MRTRVFLIWLRLVEDVQDMSLPGCRRRVLRVAYTVLTPK